MMSLEENELPETPPAAPETPAPAVETPEPVTDTDPEGTIEGSGGVKFVPLGAVVETRGKLKETKAALEAKEAENAQLREKAALADRIKGEWDAVQPLIQQMRSQQQAPPQAPAGPLSAQEAIDYAKDLDLYKADGTPDVDRAQRLAARQEKIAQKQTQAAIAPFAQQTAQQQSASNMAVVATWKDANGVTPDPTILKEVWGMMPVELTAKADVARTMFSVALGETLLRGKYKTPTTPPGPVVPTESLGGGLSRPELSSLERNFISAVDMKPKDYEEISARFKPGERNSLE